MSAKPHTVLDPDELNDTDEAILNLLHDGRVTPPYAASELDKSREYTSERLIRLKEHDHTTRIAAGLYELVTDPRGDTPDTPSVEEVQTEFESVREERDELQDTVNDLREELENTQSSVDTQRIEQAVENAHAAAERGDPQGLQSALDSIEAALQDAE